MAGRTRRPWGRPSRADCVWEDPEQRNPREGFISHLEKQRPHLHCCSQGLRVGAAAQPDPSPQGAAAAHGQRLPSCPEVLHQRDLCGSPGPTGGTLIALPGPAPEVTTWPPPHAQSPPRLHSSLPIPKQNAEPDTPARVFSTSHRAAMSRDSRETRLKVIPSPRVGQAPATCFPERLAGTHKGGQRHSILAAERGLAAPGLLRRADLCGPRTAPPRASDSCP